MAHDFFAPLGRLVQVGFHRADCLHQLILANLKLGHYSKAKAIGLERIWWLGVGGFWGLTLFFLGFQRAVFFRGEIVLLLGFGKRFFVGEKKQQQRDRGVFSLCFLFLKEVGTSRNAKLKTLGSNEKVEQFGISTYPL